MPQRMVQSLYNKRAEHLRIKAQEDDHSIEDKVGKSLAKIEKARERKQALLNSKSEKSERAIKYQF